MRDKWREMKRMAGDLLYAQPLASLFEFNATGGSESSGSAQVAHDHPQEGLERVRDDGGGRSAEAKTGLAPSHKEDLFGHDFFFGGLAAKEDMTRTADRRRQIRKALRDVTLEILRTELDGQSFKAVASSFTDDFVTSGNRRKLEPLSTLMTSAVLPPFAAQEEDAEESSSGLVFGAVLRVLGDASGEYLWHQAGNSAVAATAVADAERERRERTRRGETATGTPTRNAAPAGVLMPNSGTTWGSNRRLAMAKFDNLNNSVVDLRLPARAVGVYIQEVPVEAPLVSFNDAADLRLVLWRRVRASK